MTIEQFETATDTLKDWPNIIGIIGGEPVLHPNFIEFCEILRKKFPKEKCYLWTSGGPKYREYLPVIDETFSFIAYNEHNEFQENTCKHQPLTVAIDEVIDDEELRNTLINNCWVDEQWCGTVNAYGAYWCEVGAALDYIFFDGANAWPVVDGWWKVEPETYEKQVRKLCGLCGMAIPMERELIKKKTEKFTPNLLQMFKDKGLNKLSESDVELFDRKITLDEIKQAIPNWTPGNYRGDIADDTTCGEGLGFKGEL